MEIQFFGDLSLDGLYCYPQQYVALEDNMAWLDNSLGEADLRVVNWEAPLWGEGIINKKKEKLKYPMLCTTKEASKSILPLKINLALLANNHIYDCGDKGFYNTTDFFSEYNISHIGTRIDGRKNKPFLYDKDGVSICMLNYVGEETNPTLPDDIFIKVNTINENLILSDILKYKKKVDHVIINLHWGENELTRIPNITQRKLARLLIDNGASLIVGSHVHCLQGWEKYNNGFIIYSLGNFIFGPSLSGFGEFKLLPAGDNNKIGILKAIFSKNEIFIQWRYFFKSKNSLLLEEDIGSIKKYHRKLNNVLNLSDKQLARKYNIEVILSVIRSYINKNDGIMKSIFSLKVKHFFLIKKIFKINL